MTTTEIIERKVAQYGIGMNVKELSAKMYIQMKTEGHKTCIINDRYLECDGQNYQFIKSRANGCWMVKVF